MANRQGPSGQVGHGLCTHPHPFKNDSIFELVKALVVGASSKTAAGIDAIADAISSKRVVPGGVEGFSSKTELRWLDKFAAKSPIAGGPWQTGTVKVKMPCMQANSPGFSTEAEALEFEVPGVRFCSLVDIIVPKVRDPSTSGSFRCHHPLPAGVLSCGHQAHP